MPKISQQPIPRPFSKVFENAGIKFKQYKSSTSFERDLKRFLKRNHVLHLSTCKDNVARSTPLEYRLVDLTFYVLSAGGAKFDNLKHNNKISFSIAEPYNSDDDYWSYKGLQAWGTAEVIGRSKNPSKFNEAIKKMKISKVLKQLGQKELPPNSNYRVIKITPDRIKYGNPREGIFRVTWKRK